MPKTNSDKTERVIDAIANLRDHGDCECSVCERDKATITENLETAGKLIKLIK